MKTKTLLLALALLLSTSSNAFAFDISSINMNEISEYVKKGKKMYDDYEKMAGASSSDSGASSFNSKENNYPSDASTIKRTVKGKRLKFPINYRVLLSSDNCDKVIDNEQYQACYDYKANLSSIVVAHLDGSLVHKGNMKKRDSFYPDKSLPKNKQIKTSCYSRSGYDRGHYASDASFDYSQNSKRNTYSMINVAPMTPTLNRKAWLKIEKYSRKVAVSLGSADVINIADYSTSRKKINCGVVVPIGFYKIIYNEKEKFRKCFYLKNHDNYGSSDNMKMHVINCDKVYY